jgi:cell division protease FtsH
MHPGVGVPEIGSQEHASAAPSSLSAPSASSAPSTPPSWMVGYRVGDHEHVSLAEDVVGLDRQKRELAMIVARLRHPEAIERAGGRAAPSGILIHGPSGCGKTLLARGLATQLAKTDGVVMYAVPAADLSASRFVEIGRWLSQANEGLVVIYLDEIDAWGRARDHQLRTSTLLAALATMEGLDTRGRSHVLWIASTSLRPGGLDEALIRPGRLGWHISVTHPSLRDRQACFDAFLARVRTGEPLDTRRAARLVGQVSGAWILQVVEDAIALAISDEGPEGSVRWPHLREAIGRGGHTGSDDQPGDLHRVAVHEASHARVAELVGLPLESVSVTATEGETRLRKALSTVDRMRRELTTVMAGSEGEMIILGDRFPASRDSQEASQLASRIVMGGGTSWIPVDYMDWRRSGLARDDHYQAMQGVLAEARGRARQVIEAERAAILDLASRLESSGDLVAEELGGSYQSRSLD